MLVVLAFSPKDKEKKIRRLNSQQHGATKSPHFQGSEGNELDTSGEVWIWGGGGEVCLAEDNFEKGLGTLPTESSFLKVAFLPLTLQGKYILEEQKHP